MKVTDACEYLYDYNPKDSFLAQHNDYNWQVI